MAINVKMASFKIPPNLKSTGGVRVTPLATPFLTYACGTSPACTYDSLVLDLVKGQVNQSYADLLVRALLIISRTRAWLAALGGVAAWRGAVARTGGTSSG